MKTYDFPCGCKFPILDEHMKSNGDGLPSIGIDFNNIPHDCSLTWDLFSSGRTKGVFQLENKLGQDWSAKIQPHNIDELAAVISVIRPGCLKSYLGERNLTQHFADRKVKGEEVTYIHPSLEPILKSTYGILVYQEQAMKIAVDLAGFNLQEADTLRKAIGKKLAELMSKVEKEFISKAKECKVVPDDIAETVFSWIRESQKYSFNKCLSPTTIVQTPKGMKCLYELCIGDTVLAPGIDEDEWVEVKDVIDNGEQELYEITTESGNTIQCTLNHKLLCEDNEMHPLYEILSDNLKVICKD